MATTCDSCKKVIHANGPDVLAVCWECLGVTPNPEPTDEQCRITTPTPFDSFISMVVSDCIDGPPSPLDNCEYVEATRLSPYLY